MHLENWYTLINEKNICPELDFHFNKDLEKSLLEKAKQINENFNTNLKFPVFNKEELEKNLLFFDVYDQIKFTIRDELNFYKELRKQKDIEHITLKQKEMINRIRYAIDLFQYE